MYLYRLESFDKFIGYVNKGPWRCDNAFAAGMVPHDIDDLSHPIPYDDGLTLYENEVCGVRSMGDIDYWFPHRLKTRSKFRVVKYYVPTEHCKIGRNQVVFPAEKARVIHTLYIKD